LSASLTLAAMSLGYGVVQLDVTIVNTALSSIGNSLGGGIAELQWVVSAYTIAFAALILTAGALGDRIGAKRIFMAVLQSSPRRRSPAVSRPMPGV
jgi:DHA2 family methylenomycin A resistance protein-like MFS transporter